MSDDTLDEGLPDLVVSKPDGGEDRISLAEFLDSTGAVLDPILRSNGYGYFLLVLHENGHGRPIGNLSPRVLPDALRITAQEIEEANQGPALAKGIAASSFENLGARFAAPDRETDDDDDEDGEHLTIVVPDEPRD